jgi:hypothetical protein
MTLDLEVKGLTSLASVTEITAQGDDGSDDYQVEDESDNDL